MKNKNFLIPLLIVVSYLLIHIFKLTALPVFADEAIYIRWAQIIIDDWQRYLFYPMNDGKTPLLMWLIVPIQFIFSNQLFAARIVAVLAGLLSMIFIALISFEIFKSKKAAYLAMVFYAILPFTFFYNRMAMTDSLMFSTLTISYYFLIKLIKSKKIKYILPLALSFFLALLAKTPAILFLPIFYLTIFLKEKINIKSIFSSFLKISTSLFLAISLLYSFRFITPLFPQLFAVGGNFLYPFETLISKDIFQIFFKNIKFFYLQLASYITLPIIFFALPFSKNKKKEQAVLFLSALVYLLPLILLGKIVYSRYLLMTALFLILSSSYLLVQFKKLKLIKLLAIFIIIFSSAKFIYPSYFNVEQIPFTEADSKQFLEEWSSGHGIKEVVSYIKEVAKTKSIAIATEGSFGTLPDGILLYFHQEDVSNIYIEGIEQPVREIPDKFIERAENFDQKILVVNSYRMMMDLPKEKLLMEYPRPNNAPTLQVWKID